MTPWSTRTTTTKCSWYNGFVPYSKCKYEMFYAYGKCEYDMFYEVPKN